MLISMMFLQWDAVILNDQLNIAPPPRSQRGTSMIIIQLRLLNFIVLAGQINAQDQAIQQLMAETGLNLPAARECLTQNGFNVGAAISDVNALKVITDMVAATNI